MRDSRRDHASAEGAAAAGGVRGGTPPAPLQGSGLAGAGLNLFGVLAIREYDRIAAPPWRSAERLPGARSAIVLGSGGRGFGAALAAAPERRAADPVDRFTERIVGDAVAGLAARGVAARAIYYWQRRAGRFLDFVALGRAAGLGVPGRLGVLLHPDYGPWFALRAVLLCDVDLEATPGLPDFAPCVGCEAPCAGACPARALGAAAAPGDLDAARCADARLAQGGCELGCASRRACVVGGEHAYARTDEAHHMASARAALRLSRGAGPAR